MSEAKILQNFLEHPGKIFPISDAKQKRQCLEASFWITI